MLKKTLLLSNIFLMLVLMVACSNADDTNQAGEPIEKSVGHIATIIDISDTPSDELFGFTVLAEISEYGRIVFSHDHLEDIEATAGDVVEIMIQGDWLETDPAQVYVEEWLLVE